MSVIRDGDMKHVDSDGMRRGGRVLAIHDDNLDNMNLPTATVEHPYCIIVSPTCAVPCTEERAWQVRTFMRVHPNPGSHAAMRRIRYLSDQAIAKDRKARVK